MAASFVCAQFGVGVVFAVITIASKGRSPLLPTTGNFSLSIVVLGVIISCLSFLAPTIGAAFLWRFNLIETFALRRVRWQVYPCVLIGMMGYTVLVSTTLNGVRKLVPGFDVTALTALGKLARADGAVQFTGIFLLIVALPGTYEELVFRGFLQRGFEAKYHPATAVMLSSMFFGLVHLDPLQGLGAMLLGLYLGFMAYRTQSILPCMAAHWLQNGFFMVANQMPGEHGLKDIDEQVPLWGVALALAVATTMIASVCRLCPRPRLNQPIPALVEPAPVTVERNAASADEV